ncbi:ATP-binding protein [Actinomadura harenae]|uniref:ATP-binding protein n=2 Tax=Actinomadura harenae TaxID=2483351 RepID=A0A3M2LL39_9ACTN|nr:ATP-binding protein [Actinomadura harenae]
MPVVLAVPASLEFVREARAEVGRWLGEQGVQDADAVYQAKVIVSELVTNAIVHVGEEAGGTLELLLYRADAGPVVEVRDSSDVRPEPCPLDASTVTGRGLAIVERLALAWGVNPLASGGKAVYAVLRTGSA